MNNSTISILGCGWLGAPLARNLLAEGYKVKGSTRQAEKKIIMKDVGIKPYLLTLNPKLSKLYPDDFFQTDLLIIAIPPFSPGKEEHFHSSQIQAVATEIEKHSIHKCIYLNSIDIYPDADTALREEDLPDTDEFHSLPDMRRSELILQNISGLDLTILRCGELFGYNRIPGKSSLENRNSEKINSSVNFIHRDDVIGVVLKILSQDYWNKTLNVVAPMHPTWQDVYLKNAKEFGFEIPAIQQKNAENHQIISSEKLQNDLQYQFIYPDPLHFHYT